MKLLHNALTLASSPALARDYVRFLLSQARHGGELVRTFPEDALVVGGLSGFSEFHSCAGFATTAERRFLTTFPFGDGSILDVGGNLGIFSLLMARRFPDRPIHAFEPNPSTFEAMRANFARNHCTRVHAHPEAIAAHNGEVSFQADPVNRATTHIVPRNGASLEPLSSPTIQASCMTLDSFVEKQGIGRVGLLKIDVEGYEELVLRGAQRLLAAGNLKTIYYEVCPELTRRAGFEPDAPSRRLLALGYQLYVLDDHGGLQLADPARINFVNLENWIALWDGVASA